MSLYVNDAFPRLPQKSTAANFHIPSTELNGQTLSLGKPSSPPGSSAAGHYSLQLRNLLPAKRLQMATSFVVGVDVGSRSARAALVSLKGERSDALNDHHWTILFHVEVDWLLLLNFQHEGNLVRKAERPLEVREQKGEIFEQSGDQVNRRVFHERKSLPSRKPSRSRLSSSTL